MDEKTVGYIYILTNPSIPNYVKIGYADDVKDRVKILNNSEGLPFSFRLLSHCPPQNCTRLVQKWPFRNHSHSSRGDIMLKLSANANHWTKPRFILSGRFRRDGAVTH